MKRPKLCSIKVAKCEDYRHPEAIPLHHNGSVCLACGYVPPVSRKFRDRQVHT